VEFGVFLIIRQFLIIIVGTFIILFLIVVARIFIIELRRRMLTDCPESGIASIEHGKNEDGQKCE
jgi:hypothetical protein